jgi:hypothetical protein
MRLAPKMSKIIFDNDFDVPYRFRRGEFGVIFRFTTEAEFNKATILFKE